MHILYIFSKTSVVLVFNTDWSIPWVIFYQYFTAFFIVGHGNLYFGSLPVSWVCSVGFGFNKSNFHVLWS
jgi:hypothetical protein